MTISADDDAPLGVEKLAKEGYYLILKFSEAQLSFLVEMMKWMEEWLQENGYEPRSAIMRCAAGGYEFWAKATDEDDKDST